MSAMSWWQSEADSWDAGRRGWVKAVLRCPLGPTLGSTVAAMRARYSLNGVTVCLALYLFIDSMVRNGGVPYYLIWLTNWSAMALACFCVLDVVVIHRALLASECDADAGSRGGEDAADEPRDDDPPFFVKVLWFLKSSALVSQLTVTILFWALLYNPALPVKPRWVLSHGVLCALILLNYFFLQRYTCSHVRDVLNMYIFSVSYIAFNVVYVMIPGSTNDEGSPYVYGVLDWRARPVAAVILSMAVLLVVLPLLWGFVVAITYLRDVIAFPHVSGRHELILAVAEVDI